MTKYLAVTTMNEFMWNRYGSTMVQTFLEHWSSEVPIRVYQEGFKKRGNGRAQYLDLHSSAPWLKPWKDSHVKPKHNGLINGQYHYRQDAVKFSHKIAAIGAAADDLDGAEVLIWMDADIVTHAPVDIPWLDTLFASTAAVAWLDRSFAYPECGFLMFRFPQANSIIKELLRVYQSDDVFKLPQTHDSYVIQQVVEKAIANGEIIVSSLSGEQGRHVSHVFVNSPLGSRMDHMKGLRKEQGHSSWRDIKISREEPYWVRMKR